MLRLHTLFRKLNLALLVALSLLVPCGAVAAQTTPAAAFETLTIADGANPPIEIGIWRPADARADDAPLPLVVFSHGNGGDYRSHADTARALAGSGFVVAALTHTGDNWRDQSRAADVTERPRQLHALIDFMVDDWRDQGRIDPNRIGAFGFSSGGFTVLVAAGGEPQLSRMVPHCAANPGFYDCRLVAAHPPHSDVATTPWTHDIRIRAVVSAAPALGFTFGNEGLSAVTQPVQLWRAGSDRVLPHPFYAQAVNDALPTPPEYHVVEGADHFDFLPPCSAALRTAAPMICQETPGLDRAVFHERFNHEVVAFFQRTLTPD